MSPEAKRWGVVGASALALVVGQGAIQVFGAGVFLKPVSQDLGFGRGEISTAIGITNIMVAVGTPFFGRLIDSWGVRGPLLISIVLFALATASLSLIPGSVVGLYLLFAINGLAAVGQGPGSYSKMVSEWFDSRRGLALGIALAGVGVGTAIIPLISELLIRNLGWRGGYVGLGCIIMLLAFVPVYFLLHEPESQEADLRGSIIPPMHLPGLKLAEARRSYAFWGILVGFFLAATAINGTLVHVVPMLTDRGLTVPQAVGMMSFAGVALIVGRLIAGWLIDKIHAPYVAVFFLITPMLGLLVLALQPESVSPVVGAILLGAGIGAEVDLMSYMVSRYFGVRFFGAIYGWMFTATVLGNAVGASIHGWAYQLTKSYTATLLGACVLLLVSSLLLVRLGSYTFPSHKSARLDY